MEKDSHIGGRTLAVLAVLLLAAWLFRKTPTLQDTPQDKEGFPVLNFQDSDPAMNAAIDKARATLPNFISALGEDNPSRELFGIKMKVQDEFGRAYVWIVDVKLEDDLFTGILVNTPRHVRTVKAGQTLQVSSSKISDWSYVENGKLVGGYTMRVGWDRLSSEEQKRQESKLGFKMN